MSLLGWMVNKVKLLILCIINAVRRSFCCFSRRKVVAEPIVLTDVVSTSSYSRPKDDTNWNIDWDVDGNRKPSTVQEHIDYYRETKLKTVQPSEHVEDEDSSLNFFEDMTPKIIPQKKVILQTKSRPSNELSSRLKVSEQTFMPVIQPELTEWDDESDLMTSWEETADCDTGQAIRDKRKADREWRLAEQMRKKQEKEMVKSARQPLATKLS
uniref:Receptor-binding cancer antigen expressed on SiSo cells n=1 Tax=Cacopsylla melanoneura TaxID=428564 RepID=A0A8D8Y847_9HEMI